MSFDPTSLTSLVAQRALSAANDRLNTAIERLASGKRLNSAAEDSASLAIADKLQRDGRVAARATQNATDGISAVHVADHVLGQESEILGRLSELASQAANGTLTDGQRSAIQTEFGSLVSQLDQKAATTTFNGVSLLSAGATVTLEVGTSVGPDARISFTTVDGSASGLGLSNIAVSTQAAAQAAIGAIGSAVAAVSQDRGNLGAVESKLRKALSDLRASGAQFAAAESRIRDTDVAQETAERIRSAIHQRTTAALLGQANQNALSVLRLLR